MFDGELAKSKARSYLNKIVGKIIRDVVQVHGRQLGQVTIEEVFAAVSTSGFDLDLADGPHLKTCTWIQFSSQVSSVQIRHGAFRKVTWPDAWNPAKQAKLGQSVQESRIAAFYFLTFQLLTCEVLIRLAASSQLKDLDLLNEVNHAYRLVIV